MRIYYHDSDLDPRFIMAWERQKEKCVLFNSIVELKDYIKMFNELRDYEKTEWYMWVCEYDYSFEEAFDRVWPETFTLLYPDVDDSIEAVVEHLNNKVIIPDYMKTIWNTVKTAFVDHADLNEEFINFLEDNNVIGEFVNPADGETWYYYKGE